jgi:hypothetical protein
MKLPNLITRAGLLLTFLVSGLHLDAADPTNTPPKGAPSVAWERRLKDVHWDGIPLDEIVKTLRDQFPEINFIVARNVQSESVSLILREVKLEELFKALEFATEGRVRTTWNQNERLVTFEKPPPTTPQPGDPATCRVFNLSRFLADKECKDLDAAVRSVTEALEDGWRMLREANNDLTEYTPRLSFHKGSKLLIVVGRPLEVNVADELVRELQGPEPRGGFRRGFGAAPNDFKRELQGAAPGATIPAPREQESDKPKPKPEPPPAAKP